MCPNSGTGKAVKIEWMILTKFQLSSLLTVPEFEILVYESHFFFLPPLSIYYLPVLMK